MKARINLGKKRSGVVLSAFLALCVLIFSGCKKDSIDPPIVDETLSVTAISVNGTLFPKYEATMTVSIFEGSTVTIEVISNAEKVLVSVGSDTVTMDESNHFYSDAILSDTIFSITLIKGNEVVVRNANVAVIHVIQEPTGSISAKPSTERILGESTTIYWSSPNATSAILKINGKDTTVQTSDSMTVVLQATTNYEITFSNEIGSYTPSILTVNIIVLDKDYYLTHGGKVMIEWEVGYSWDSLYPTGVPAELMNHITYFYPNDRYETFHISDGALVGNGGWHWEEVNGETYLNWGGWFTRLDSISSEVMILSGEGGGNPPISRWTFDNIEQPSFSLYRYSGKRTL